MRARKEITGLVAFFVTNGTTMYTKLERVKKPDSSSRAEQRGAQNGREENDIVVGASGKGGRHEKRRRW